MTTIGNAVGYNARILGHKLGWPTTYQIQIELPGGSKTINRRYKDFARLREGLLELGDTRGTLPDLPPKAGPSMLRGSFREARQDGLEHFLAEALSRSRLDSEPWRTFLETSVGEVEVLSEAPPESDQASSPDAVETATQPRSEMDEIREMRRQRWHQQRGNNTPQTPVTPASSSSTAPPPVSEEAVAASEEQAAPEELTRVSLLPLQEIPEEIDSEQLRHEALKNNLKLLREQGSILEAGMVLKTSMGYDFAVVKCFPDRGFITASTLHYVNGPVLPLLRRVEFVALREHRRGQSEDQSRRQLMNDHVVPHFRSTFAASRVGVVCINDILEFRGVNFEVAGLDPETVGWGLVASDTEIFARLHQLPEFTQIHVVPFSDTLPSAYQYDVFQDYVKPYFKSHRTDAIREGDTFYQNGVHFKVVATEPSGRASCRVGLSTVVFTEGLLHPSASELLSPEQQRQLALLPPPLQMLVLQTTMFGDGEIAERIMEAQSRRSTRSRGLTSSALDTMTEEVIWSQELQSQLNIEQADCTVCLTDFQDGDRVRLLQCSHVFHTACIDEWLGRDAHCPLCRHSLRSPNNRGRRS
jgi:hypothetical protein